MSTKLKGRPLTFPLTTDTPCREWQGCTDQDGYGVRKPKTRRYTT